MSNELAIIDALNAPANLGLFSSLDLTSFEDKRATLAYLMNAEKLSDHLGETFALRHVIAHPVTVTTDDVDEETSEYVGKEMTRIVLISDDGKAYYTVSPSVGKAIHLIIATFGPPAEWETALPVTLVEQRSRKGRTFHTVVVKL